MAGHPRPGALRGFGLLEALVALAVFSAAGLALFEWVGTSLAQASAARQREAEDLALRQAQAWLQTVDPLASPQGRASPAPGLSVSWVARALGPATGVVPLPGGRTTPFVVTLFELEAQVTLQGRQASVPLKVTKVGVRRTEPVAQPAALP